MATINQLQRIHRFALWLQPWRSLLLLFALCGPLALVLLLMQPYNAAQELWLQACVALEVALLFLLFSHFLMRQLPVWTAVSGTWPRFKQWCHQSWYRALALLWWLMLLICLYLLAKTAKSILAFYLS
ncbi:hypothetical protein [Rheinheimera sp.]|uniref:hypothetical protein n=1 Tax=Rheinheimera sp. TaxID=1869214 RepID=UPI003AF47764